VVTAHRTSDLVRDLGFRSVTELAWGQKTRVGSLEITAAAVNHWGARTLYDQYRGFNAYLLDAGDRRVLYGGDTAYHEGFKSLPKVDLAIVGIGAYDPWIHSHATPEQAMSMADHVSADYILPMHHSTFKLSHEPTAEPIERMLAAAGRNEDRVVVRQIGGQWSLN
jgi:L-ascorbate metabolism protein UlaG (beta-lactamase superfamily)